VLFPLGGFRKEETRALAREFGLPVAAKAESQEICFVPGNDYGAFLACHAGLQPQPGAIVDVRGRVLGRHRGIPYYTIGQRRGLGIATGQPLYVVAIDAERNEVVVGTEEDLYADSLLAEGVNLIAEPALAGSTKATAKIRYRAVDAEAEASQPGGDRLLVRFRAPQRAITPGQAVVLYQGDVVLGGGTIAAVGRGSAAAASRSGESG
jgi:tRNA-specific 2-thiouridylase